MYGRETTTETKKTKRLRREIQKRLSRLQDKTLVAGAAGDLLAIEVFEQGDGVLARDAGEILEGGDVDQAVWFVLGGVCL